MISLKDCNCLSSRVKEALDSLRYKPVKSTTLERLKISVEAEKAVRGYSQPLQLGHGLNYILDHIETPIHAKDLILGRILEEVPDQEGERFFQDTLREMGARPSWIKDWGHECFDWNRLLKFGLKGLEDYAKQQLLNRKEEKAEQTVLDFL